MRLNELVTIIGILEYTAPDPQGDSQMTTAEEEQFLANIPD